MGVIKSLFDIERVAAPLSEVERKDLRQRLAKPNLDLLKTWLDSMQKADSEMLSRTCSIDGPPFWYTLTISVLK